MFNLAIEIGYLIGKALILALKELRKEGQKKRQLDITKEGD